MTFPPAKEAAALLVLAHAGDIRAFSQLMEAEQSRLLAQAQTFCTDHYLAQDLVQETMIAAWKSLHRFDGSCRLFTWLYVILLRQHQRSLGWFSRRLPLATLEQQAFAKRQLAQMQEPDVVAAAEAELLQVMIAALSARHQEIIRLRFFAQASEAETALALGVAVGTVKSRLHHALEKLRRMKEKVNLLRDTDH